MKAQSRWSGVTTPSDRDADLGLTERVYQQLRDDILTARFQPGDRLSVPDIAHKLEVSRSPAREAITRITHEGLATANHNRGAVVAALDRADLIEIYQLREMLEALACRLAAAQMTENTLQQLRQIHEEHTTVVDSGDVNLHYEKDAQFHATIREATDSPRLSESLERLQGQIRLGMRTTHRPPGAMRRAIRDHRLILAAVEAGNPEFAETAVRLHIGRLTTELEQQYDHNLPETDVQL